MSKRLDEGWDGYCVAEAKAHLLREAAALITRAGAKGVDPSLVVKWSSMAARIISFVGETMATSRIVAEAEVEAFVRKTFEFEVAEARGVMVKVKVDAKALRGQLDMFETEHRRMTETKLHDDAQSFVNAELCDASGKLIFVSVLDEMIDYFNVCREVAKAYWHVTGGKLSKPNTDAVYITSAHDETVREAVEQAIAEQSVEDLRKLLAEKEGEPPCDE